MTTHLQMLEKMFPGQALIGVVDAGRCLCFAAQTTRNKLAAGQFPVQTFLLGGKRVVKKIDLALFLDSLGFPSPRRGRPKGSTKVARRCG